MDSNGPDSWRLSKGWGYLREPCIHTVYWLFMKGGCPSVRVLPFELIALMVDDAGFTVKSYRCWFGHSMNARRSLSCHVLKLCTKIWLEKHAEWPVTRIASFCWVNRSTNLAFDTYIYEQQLERSILIAKWPPCSLKMLQLLNWQLHVVITLMV